MSAGTGGPGASSLPLPLGKQKLVVTDTWGSGGRTSDAGPSCTHLREDETEVLAWLAAQEHWFTEDERARGHDAKDTTPEAIEEEEMAEWYATQRLWSLADAFESARCRVAYVGPRPSQRRALFAG